MDLWIIPYDLLEMFHLMHQKTSWNSDGCCCRSFNGGPLWERGPRVAACTSTFHYVGVSTGDVGPLPKNGGMTPLVCFHFQMWKMVKQEMGVGVVGMNMVAHSVWSSCEHVQGTDNLQHNILTATLSYLDEINTTEALCNFLMVSLQYVSRMPSLVSFCDNILINLCHFPFLWVKCERENTANVKCLSFKWEVKSV